MKKATQTKMPPIPYLCLFILAAITGVSLSQPFSLIIKLFILGDSAATIVLCFIAYKFFLQEEKTS